jgi:hypothetical protein
MEKQIANLKKQNEGMENGFKNKGIQFTKLSIDSVDLEKEILFLKDYNEYLKNISKQNRPPPQEKPKVEETQVTQPKPNVDEDEDDDDISKDVKPVYSTITNMEDIKRAFFSKEYDTAFALIKQHPFKFYKANYKYADDNTGRPSFVAKNLLRGLVQTLDDCRKYFMICFRCILINKEISQYKYPSYWVVNTNDDLKVILGSNYDDYDFIQVEDEETYKMLRRMEKNENETDDDLIGEVYLH